MDNTFMTNLKDAFNYTSTANGALAHKSTNSAVYDMFAFGGAYRNKTDGDIILLFKNALDENTSLAMKCLFYLRDCIYGQGERRFFRTAFRWLTNNYPEIAWRCFFAFETNMCRWDDLIYTCINTPLETHMINMIAKQLRVDLKCKTPSLLAKWMPSENTSSFKTKSTAYILRTRLGLTSREYRKVLSELRNKINIVERLMSENRWDEIEFDKIPSKAGLKYKNAFARRDIIAEKYNRFMTNESTTVNAKTLYPYEVVAEALKINTDNEVVEKYWKNLPDYLNGNPCKILCVVDTSGSMTWGYNSSNVKPLNVAISLGMYCAERISGPFKNHYISFSRYPQLIKIEGVNFKDKVRRIYNTNLCENTDLERTFNLIFDMATQKNVKKEDIPETIVVISDMQIDQGSCWSNKYEALTDMEMIHKKFAAAGLECPKLVYWNVNAAKPVILDASPNVSYVSGMSPVLFEQILSGKTGYDLMLDKLNSERYKDIH